MARIKKAKKAGAVIGAAKPVGSKISKVRSEMVKPGIRPVTKGEARKEFKKRFEGLTTEQKHAEVKKVMAKRFGGEPWQKKVYGEKYKPGTVGKQTKQIKGIRKREKESTGKLKSLEAAVGGATGESKAALQKRLSTLKTHQKQMAKSLTRVKGSRQKFLSLREKALQGIAVKAAVNPKSLAKARKKLARKKLKGKKATVGKGGGVGMA